MSNLQEAAKPLIIPLLDGSACTLDRYQQQIVAAWATMAVMCMEFDEPDRVVSSKADRQWLKDHREPPRSGWKIWIGNYVRGDWPSHYAHNAFSFTEEDIAQIPRGHTYPPNTQATTYAVGQLFVHLISSVYEEIARDWRFAPEAADYLKVIWPCDGPIAWPPNQTLADRHADHIAAEFGRRFDRKFAPTA